MKKTLLSLLIALASLASAASFDADTALAPLKPTQQQSQAAHLAAEVLTRYHYKPQPLDDAMSTKIFDRYLKTLDPDKLIFLKSDRLIAWKPPLSVRIGPGQFMNLCRPPKLATRSAPGRSIR